MKDKDMKRTGKMLRIYRVKQGLTQAALAEKLNISTGYLGQIERGVRGFGLDTLRKVIYCINIPLDFFLDPEKFMERFFMYTKINLFEIDINKEILKESQVVITFYAVPIITRRLHN